MLRTAAQVGSALGSDGGATPQWLRWFAAVVYSDVEGRSRYGASIL